MSFERTEPYNDLPLLPPDAELESREILRQALQSARALADLRGAAGQIPNQGILINGIILQEARSSSEIENIVTTSDELYRAAASPDEATDPQTKEVLRYSGALWRGFQRVQTRPICTNLFVEVNQDGEVIYTPPLGEELLREKLANLENYLNASDGPDPLIRLAVMHYQFEAIHPFTDGNGRTGRIINILYLVESKLLDQPVLYLSQYIFKHRKEYYAGLRAVTEERNWEGWILFMLRAVEETAKQTLDKVHQIVAAMRQTADQVRQTHPKMYSKDLIEVLYANPYCRIAALEEAGLGNRQTVSVYLKRLAELDIVKPLKVGREMYYINERLVTILSSSASS